MPDRTSAGLLLDTHAWLWYANGDRRMNASARSTIDSVHPDVWLSPISIWELGVLLRRGRIEPQRGLDEWVTDALGRLPMRDALVTREIAMGTESLDLPHHDPADRIIAATTMAYGLRLVTADRVLTSARWLPTLSA